MNEMSNTSTFVRLNTTYNLHSYLSYKFCSFHQSHIKCKQL
uniref:Uncharacterized protein n=1 Tax=Anguilla anguilla TaxID=7936 RepID=A0A0E9SH69_ANGAN